MKIHPDHEYDYKNRCWVRKPAAPAAAVTPADPAPAPAAVQKPNPAPNPAKR